MAVFSRVFKVAASLKLPFDRRQPLTGTAQEVVVTVGLCPCLGPLVTFFPGKRTLSLALGRG